MSIDSIITRYLQAKAAEAAAKKDADTLRELILQHAAGADHFTTADYIVTIKETASVRLDSARLYKDFPDIKTEYGKTTVSRSVTATVKTAADRLPA